MDGVKFFWYLDGKDEGNKIDPSAPANNEIAIKKKNINLGDTHYIYMQLEGNDDEGDGYIKYTAPMVRPICCVLVQYQYHCV